jgi:predicted CoA-binding protein
MQPDSETLRTLLRNAKTIAIVGAKDAPGQPVDGVGRYLMVAGYTIIPVHPVRQNIWGLPTYKSIGDLPGPMDIIDLFRAAECCPDHAREVLDLSWKPGVFWMQLGIASAGATALLEPAGITVVQDACIKVEHKRLLG